MATKTTGAQQYMLTVDPAIVVSPTSPTGLAIATVGNNYSQTITASGGAGSPFTFTTADPLDGLTLSKSGLLSGMPTTNGSFTFTVTATDGIGATGTQQYTLTVNPPIVVSPTSPTGLAIATVGNAYNQTITASGGAGGTLAFSETGSLDGLALNPSTGKLTGSPTANGSFTFTVTATDSNNATGARTYTLTVNPAIHATPTSLPAVGLGLVYKQQLTASGGSGKGYTFSTSSALDGLTLSTAGLLSGKPTAKGSFPIVVHITDSNGASGSQNYTLSVVVQQQTIGVFDLSTANWYLRNSNSAGGANYVFQFGAPGWFPVVGDWNGDGVTTIGVVDLSTETWYLRNSNSGGGASYIFQFGAPGWIPVVGDWTGTGHTGIGAFDPTTGTWYLRNEVSNGGADAGQFQYGAPGWLPVVGDWNGLGKTTIGVIDPSTETWYLRTSNSDGGANYVFQYGVPGWRPVVGDWNALGHSGIGLLNPATGTWYLRNELSGGGADAGVFSYGAGSWIPLAGDWDYPALPQLAAGGEAAVPSTAAPLTESQLQGEVQVALKLLASDGVNSALLARLGALQFSVGELPSGYLGLSDLGTGIVEISANAAGYGWFVDANPLHDPLFVSGVAQPGSTAANRMDLLTVVLHEMGHFDGWSELDPTTHPDALMALTLGTGQRRILDIDAVFAAGL